jgi:AcrR family transcriptional regulator
MLYNLLLSIYHYTTNVVCPAVDGKIGVMALEFQNPSGWIDPRVLRTKKMLLKSLQRLLEEKNIDQISVADIAEGATLNRATFYDHYADKFALLEGLVESGFQELLVKRKVTFDGACSSGLQGIALVTCDYMAGLMHSDCPDRRQMEKHFEAAMISVLRGMILCGLQKHPPRSGIPGELVAASVSGAICTGAREWARTPNRSSAEEAANSIFALIQPMMA